MLFDELSRLDPAFALDSKFARTIRLSGEERLASRPRLTDEQATRYRESRQRNNNAALDPKGSGMTWNEHGQRWDRIAGYKTGAPWRGAKT